MSFSPRTLALAATVLSTVLSSVAWITEREAVLILGPLTTAAFSCVLGGAVLLFLARWRKALPDPHELRLHWRSLLFLWVTRTMLGHLFLIYALTMTTSSKVMFLTKIEPYLIVFWFWLIKQERVSRAQLTLLAVHVAGAVLLSTGGSFAFDPEQLGDLLVVLGIAANALSYAPAQSLTRTLGAFATSGLTAFTGGIVLLPLALLIEPWPFRLAGDYAHGWYNLVLTVVIFYVIATALWFYSLKGIKAWLASALRCIGPVVAAPIAWLAYDQPLTSLQLTGAAVVLVTSVLMVREREEHHGK